MSQIFNNMGHILTRNNVRKEDQDAYRNKQ